MNRKINLTSRNVITKNQISLNYPKKTRRIAVRLYAGLKRIHTQLQNRVQGTIHTATLATIVLYMKQA